MRNKFFLFVTVASVVGLFSYEGVCKLMGYSIFENTNKANYVTPIYSGREGQLFPDVDLLMVDSVTHMNIKDIPSGKPTVLFYFGPYCPYCQAEIENITKHIESLQNVQIYLLTAYSYAEMKSFYDRNMLSRYDNIKIGIDYKYKFGRYFNTSVVPCTAIYSSKGKLNSVYLGPLKYDQIKVVSEK
ncbi:TlpA family protein disulfide reductase [Chitinophaga arvensicola]|uniref:AhpC/TSA family protein n=1 Tax=Chitinophaga arvensicola TaxID=29529 RepID=A0A1I0SB28_9BACT|nr:redoxin domain-containing protein [Chitinophaga arvensicola]SEW53926.1 AhpC/TSA family protein [Chitinophaga arvensicola]